MRTQKKVLSRIRAAIEGQGLEYRHSPALRNSGTVRALQGADAVMVVRYHFRRRYCTLIIGGPLATTYGRMRRPPEYRVARDELAYHYLRYDEAGSVENMFTAVGTLLGGREG